MAIDRLIVRFEHYGEPGSILFFYASFKSDAGPGLVLHARDAVPDGNMLLHENEGESWLETTPDTVWPIDIVFDTAHLSAELLGYNFIDLWVYDYSYVGFIVSVIAVVGDVECTVFGPVGDIGYGDLDWSTVNNLQSQISLPKLKATGRGISGGVGRGAGTLQSLAAIGGKYGRGVVVFPAFTGSGESVSRNALISQCAVLSSMGCVIDTPEKCMTALYAGTDFEAGVIESGEIVASLSASSDLVLDSVLHVWMYSTIAASSVMPTAANHQSVWVVNAETYASSRYEHYPYNSFAMIDGQYYGARDDGIYLLDGNMDEVGDASVPVQAMVSFGKQDFETSKLKRVEHCYLGMSAQGNLYLKVMAEGKDYLYACRSASEHIQTQRVDIGRGLRVNYFEFELYNMNGDDFELASVEFAAVELSRRI